MFKLTYTKEFNFKKIKKYKFVIGLLLATTVAAYSNTLDVSEPPPEPIVIVSEPIVITPEPVVITKYITIPGPTPDPVIITKIIAVTEIIPCPPAIIKPDLESDQPAWYLGGNGEDESNGNDDTNENNNDNGLDGHGQDHGGHGSHGSGHGYGHK